MVRGRVTLAFAGRVALCLALLASACGKGSSGAADGGPNTATHDRFPITTGPHAVACNICHGDGASFREFNCTACHAHDQGLTDQLHKGVATYSYTATTCFTCHADGSRQAFDHAGIATGCADCHAVGAPFAALPFTPAGGGTFTHPDMNGYDCAACHSRTYWQAGAAPAGSTSDPARNVLVNALMPTYTGTSIESFTPQAQTLAMPMSHTSTALPSAVMSGCANCHVITRNGSYYPGKLHASLASLGLAQPDACLECHSTSMPVGFVGPTATSPVRVPPSGEMKHDAVVWAKGAPTTTPAAPVECGLCHAAPQASSGRWSASKSGGTTAVFHASLSAAAQPQPGSCVDCHANTRPSGVLTAAVAALPSGVKFDHGASVALGDCVSCHASSSTWTGGKFHLAGGATPTNCASCHEGERPTSTAGWVNATYQTSPFDYATHGAGLDCASCHAGPGTGAWGSTQNWVSGSFAHGAGTPSAMTCVACHSWQRPDLNGVQPSQLPGSFDHAANGSTDCLACHQATVSRGTYARYRPIPGGDWRGGLGPPAGLTFDVAQDVMLTAGIPSWSGASIVSVTPRSETLLMQMLHGSSQVPAAIGASCANCHADAASGGYYPGVFHASLSALGAAQPSACLDCHAGAAPTGFVGPIATNPARNPPSAEMKHEAVAWAGGKAGTTALVTQDCAQCHLPPLQATAGAWGVDRSGASSALYHASLAAPPTSCIDCHANTRPSAVLTSTGAALPPGVQFDHTASVALADCASCHTGPGSGAWGGTQNWVSGSFAHGVGTLSASTCVACHSSQRPDLNGVPASQLPGSFDHATSGTGDCLGCHQATVGRASYVAYLPIPGGDWRGGVGYPGDKLIGAADQNIKETEITLNRGAGNLVVGTSVSTTTLYDQMLHTTANGTAPRGMPSQVYPGPAASPDPTTCWHCHTSSSGTVTSFLEGRFHSALSNYSATPGGAVTPLPQPSSCADCHGQMPPAGIVEKSGSDLQAMDHSAAFTSGTTVAQMDCAACHQQPGSTWSDGGFHPLIGSATPSDCVVCHYPLMADAAKADVTSGTNFAMKHASTQLAIQTCNTCHAAALSMARTTPLSASLWQGGALHADVPAQPTL